MGRITLEKLRAMGKPAPEAQAPSSVLGTTLSSLERVGRLIGAYGGAGIATSLPGWAGRFIPGVRDWLPDPLDIPEAARQFVDVSMQGDVDAGIEAYQDAMAAGPGFWGASEAITGAIAPVGAAAVGGRVLAAAPQLGRFAPYAVGLGKTLRAPWEIEEAIGRGAMLPFKAGARWLRGTPPPTAPLAETVQEVALDVPPSVVERVVPTTRRAEIPTPLERARVKQAQGEIDIGEQAHEVRGRESKIAHDKYRVEYITGKVRDLENAMNLDPSELSDIPGYSYFENQVIRARQQLEIPSVRMRVTKGDRRVSAAAKDVLRKADEMLADLKGKATLVQKDLERSELMVRGPRAKQASLQYQQDMRESEMLQMPGSGLVDEADDLVGLPLPEEQVAPPMPTEGPSGQYGPEGPLMTDLQDIGEVIDISQRPDVGRKLANFPVIKQIYGPLNRAAVAGKVELQALVGRAILMSQGQQKTQAAMSRLRELGSFEDVFGKVDKDTGLIAEDPVKGAGILPWGGREMRLSGRTPGMVNPLAKLAPNDIRTRPDDFAGITTQKQKDWIKVAQDIEDAKLKFLDDNGIDVNELGFDEGGVYAGRRVYAKKDSSGRIISTQSFSSQPGPGRVGSKMTSEGERQFATQAEALKEGYMYLPEDEALALNVQAAYNKVANKKFLDWLQATIPDTLPEGEAGLTMRKLSAEEYKKIRFGEEYVGDLGPGFAGDVFGGDRAGEAKKALEAGLHPQFSNALGKVNKVNALGRFFTLAADVSPFNIQLLFLSGYRPGIVYTKALPGFFKAMVNPEFHQAYMNKHRATLARHNILTTLQGNEMTEAMEKGGILHSRAVTPIRKLFEPFQRGFNTALDVAGVELAEGLEHLAKNADGSVDAAKMADVDAFINEIRGLASSQTVGASAQVRQWETTLLLAPRYNRAIAALLWDATLGVVETVGRGGPQTMRTRLARDAMVKSMSGLMALNTAITTGRYMLRVDRDDWNMADLQDDIGEHLDPRSSRFFTWDVGGRNIGPGTKVRSVIQLLGRSFTDPSAFDPRNIDDAGGLYQFAMNNPTVKFLRGSLAPVPSGATDILSGYTYIGEPTRGEIGDPKTYLNAATEVVLPDIMPIWTQALLLEGGSIRERAVGAGVEFIGGRGSPMSTTQRMQEMHRLDPATRDTPYEELSLSQLDEYSDRVVEETGDRAYRGPRGKDLMERDRIKQLAVADMAKAATHLKDTPFSKGHLGKYVREEVGRIERNKFRELYGKWNEDLQRMQGGVYERLYPGRKRDEPEKDTRAHILWRYYKMYDDATVKEEVAPSVEGMPATTKEGSLDFEKLKLEADLWGSLDEGEREWLLNSIRRDEQDYPPAIQQMKHAKRWLGAVKVDLEGIPTGYWDIPEHPSVKKVMRLAVPELSTEEIDYWFDATSSVKEGLEVQPLYRRLAQVKSQMERGTGPATGLIKQFKLQFLNAAPEGWYSTMLMYGYHVYGEGRGLDAMREAYMEGAPLPTVPYEELYEESKMAMNGVGVP